jgi:hypothetical protein
MVLLAIGFDVLDVMQQRGEPRFPHDDWYLLPVLETVYYAVGVGLER